MKFPIDASKKDILKTFSILGFVVVREGNHIILEKKNIDGTITPLVIPNHKVIKSSTLHSALSQSGITREDFINAYQKV